MNVRYFDILTDENVAAETVSFFRQLNFNVLDVKEEQWMGKADIELLNIAYKRNRIVVTHDSDFGKIIFTQAIPFVGIIYLRPGHFLPEVSQRSINAILQSQLDVSPSFILVAENNGKTVKLRYREVI